MKQIEYMYASQIPKIKQIIEMYDKSIELRRSLIGLHHQVRYLFLAAGLHHQVRYLFLAAGLHRRVRYLSMCLYFILEPNFSALFVVDSPVMSLAENNAGSHVFSRIFQLSMAVDSKNSPL